uniref:SFRICE_001462 n=1 Tax=Spodoptera frugiperda TaxID=7108 RepID=A0A2H1VIN5_SPOFR
MSDMIINDSVPVDKKWNELIRYNIFIMKLVEFVISLVLMIIPFVMTEPVIFHCLAVAPTLVLAIVFAVLYLVDQVHDLAEQLYLILQIFFNLLAFMIVVVVALLLNILPHVVEPLDLLHCLVAGPTVVCSTLLMVLYIVDQVQYEAEFYYVVIELFFTVLAFINLFIIGKLIGALYGLFYADLIIAFSLDLFYMRQERGITF